MFSSLNENYSTDSEIYKRFIQENTDVIVDTDGVTKNRYFLTFNESFVGEFSKLFKEAEEEIGEEIECLFVLDDRTGKDELIYKYHCNF